MKSKINYNIVFMIVFLIFLFRVFIPIDVKSVIQGPKIAFNIYSYIPKMKKENSIFSNFNFSLKYSFLGDIDINSDSSIYNTYTMLIWVLFITCLYICLFLLIKSKLTEIQENNWCLIKKIKFIILKLYNFMTFGFYIRHTLEMSQFLLICAIYETFEFNTTNSFHIISLAFAISVVLFYLSLLGFIFYLIFSMYTVNDQIHNKLEEFFRGIKQYKMSRFYVAAILIRRMLYITIFAALTLASVDVTIGSISISSVQLLFVIYFHFQI